jgi:putative alpha-1,2-mannosidase
MKQKFLIGALVLVVLAVIMVWFFVFYAPVHFKRDVAVEKGIQITATALVKAYQENEVNANTFYLDKTIEIKGEISDTKVDQAGNTTLTLKSSDAFASIFCTLKKKDSSLKIGQTVTVKGICTGFLSDVVLTEAIIVP